MHVSLVSHEDYAAKINKQWRHNCLYESPRPHARSFVACAIYVFNEANQSEKVLGPEQCAPRRDGDEWILWPNVRPVERHGRFASLRIEKENTNLARQSPYAIYFKLDISVWMKRVCDPEGFGVKVLLGCS